MSDKLQRRPANLNEAKFRCREAVDALIDIEIALAAPGVFGSTLLVSHARLKLGVARDSVFELRDDLERLCDLMGAALTGGGAA